MRLINGVGNGIISSREIVSFRGDYSDSRYQIRVSERRDAVCFILYDDTAGVFDFILSRDTGFAAYGEYRRVFIFPIRRSIIPAVDVRAIADGIKQLLFVRNQHGGRGGA